MTWIEALETAGVIGGTVAIVFVAAFLGTLFCKDNWW